MSTYSLLGTDRVTDLVDRLRLDHIARQRGAFVVEGVHQAEVLAATLELDARHFFPVGGSDDVIQAADRINALGLDGIVCVVDRVELDATGAEVSNEPVFLLDTSEVTGGDRSSLKTLGLAVRRFETSAGLKAAIVRSYGFEGVVHFEAQNDGVGMVWPTLLRAHSAVELTLLLLGAPDADDAACVIESDGSVFDLPSEDIAARVARAVDPVFVRIEIGEESVVWGRAQDGGPGDYGEMGYAADHYERFTVGALLQGTGDVPGGWRLEQILDVADETFDDGIVS